MKLWRLLIFGFLFVFSGTTLLFILLVRAPQSNQPLERFVVNQGASEEEIINDLVQKGFLRNREIFRLFLTSRGWHGKILPGSYLISQSMNVFELAQTLVFKPYQRWVTLLPGWRKEQAAAILQKTFQWSPPQLNEFLAAAEEGYLYPDTYLINLDYSPTQVYQKIKNNFNEKFDTQLQADLLAQNIRNDTAVKIASLVERESGSDEDKPIIAGILWNRLNKGMRLEIDATVQYAKLIQDSKFKIKNFREIMDWWPKVTPEDLKGLISPYNTYLNDGLPPGPICSPTIESIRAVAHPAETKALYYLHSADRKIHTAETYEEHLQNIQKYLPRQ